MNRCLLIIGIFLFSSCTSETTFDIFEAAGSWYCHETSNTNGDELLSYQVVIEPTGEYTCTIDNFTGESVKISANVSDSWAITIPEQKVDEEVYWGSGQVNIKKKTMQLTMAYRYGDITIIITSDCEKVEN
ncbi:MAG: hypothetical protein LBQ60_03065 [Bacteroidales bacterium]|jgi:hypothetical protein|nr:hypothetical protein [Bacteroidales bacterium]